MDSKWKAEELRRVFLEGDRDAQERINGLSQDGAEKDSEEPMLILLVFRLLK